MNFRRDWNDFWYTLRPATSLALFRILFGSIMFAWTLLALPDVQTWYTENGVFPLAAMRAWNEVPYGLDILAYVTNVYLIYGTFGLMLLSAFCMAIGYRTRIAQVAVAVLLVSINHRDVAILNGGDSLQRNIAFLMMFAESGAACSVDRLVRIRKGLERAEDTPMVESWPQRLLQLQLACVYIATVASKEQGAEWHDGTALYFALHLTDLRRFSLFGLRNDAWFYVSLTYFTLFAEFSLGTLIWSRRLRPYVLAIGIALHLGIEYAMTVPLFSYTMIACYMNFVPQQWIDNFLAWASRRIGTPLDVPASVRLPGKYAEMLHAFDCLHLIRPSEEAPRSVDATLILRAFWRFPATWAAVFGPAALVLAVIPIRWYLIPFDLFWPIVSIRLLKRTASRVAERLGQGDPDGLGSELTDDSKMPSKIPVAS